MDTRLNALIAEARSKEIVLQSTRPRLEATTTPALAPSSRLRRGSDRLLRLANARGASR